MKYAIALIFILYAGKALAQAAPVHGPNGEFLGHAVKNGNTTVFVDKNGKYGGAVVQGQHGMTHIDQHGNHRPVRPGYGAPGYGRPGYGHYNQGYGQRPGYNNGYGHHYGNGYGRPGYGNGYNYGHAPGYGQHHYPRW